MRAAVIATLFVAACDYQPAAPPGGLASDTSAGEGDTIVVATVSWHRDLRPIVDRSCNGCHAIGGIAPVTFEDPDEVQRMGPIIAGAVTTGEMPPWPMDPTCRDIRDARVLDPTDVALFATWKDEGYPLGDPADYVAPDRPAATTSTSTIGQHGVALTRTDGYAPDATELDDYRCFLFPQVIDAASWIRGVHITPDEQPLVHHVLLFMIPADAAGDLEALDAASPDLAGYECQGGSGATGDTMVAGWVPGSQPTLFPERGAIPAPVGSRFVMQMHYNTINADLSRPIPEDTTGGWLELLPTNEDPSHVIAIRPVLDPNLAIAPDDPAAVEGVSLPVRWTGDVVGVAPHMHTRGTSIRVRLEHDAGGESCLGDIPAWDFHWQQTYIYEPDAYVAAQSGDTVHLECVYDNSADNQPIIDREDGTSNPPPLVTWGEGTDDEMCLAYLVLMTPFVPDAEPTGVCPGFSDCFADCASGDAMCPVQCLMADGGSCTTCGVREVFTTCGKSECPTQSAALAACLAGCDKSPMQCAATKCKATSDSLYACLEGPLRFGACDGPCGIEVVP